MKNKKTKSVTSSRLTPEIAGKRNQMAAMLIISGCTNLTIEQQTERSFGTRIGNGPIKALRKLFGIAKSGDCVLGIG